MVCFSLPMLSLCLALPLVIADFNGTEESGCDLSNASAVYKAQHSSSCVCDTHNILTRTLCKRGLPPFEAKNAEPLKPLEKGRF